MINNSLHISGLASGIDTEQMITDLMKAERTKVDKLEQQKQLAVWKQEIYNDLNKEFANFILETKKEFGLTTMTSTGVLLSKSVSSLSWVKSATSSDSGIAEIEARADATMGTYNIKVKGLAANWASASSANISTGDTTNLATQFGLADGDNINFTITTDEGSVTIDRTGLSNISIYEIANEINDADIGVKAIYDGNADRFFLQTEDTGSSKTIQITDSSILTSGKKFITGDSLLKLQYYDEVAGSYQNITDGQEYKGKDAVIDFDAATDIKFDSNQFTINGLNFDLKSTGNITVNVGTDIDNVYEKIESFVEKYNELVEKLNEKLSEKRYRDYLPLTEEQKKEMTEEEIKLWEEKAKSGLIKNDGILQNIAQNMRTGLYEDVEGVKGVFDQLTQIGISTEVYSRGSLGGKLVINEVELKEAIEEDVDSVLELLFKEPSGDLKYKSESTMTAEEIAQKRSESGLVGRLYDNIIEGMKEIVYKAGSGDNQSLYDDVSHSIMVDFITEFSGISILDKDIDKLDDKIDDMNDYLIRVEDRYWSQFTAMEKAISQMNQQSAWLMQQFGGGAQ